MPRWLVAVIGAVGTIIVIATVTILVLEIQFRRELKRRSGRDDKIWYTTGSPMVWTQDLANHLED